jgi:hypothetical protein
LRVAVVVQTVNQRLLKVLVVVLAVIAVRLSGNLQVVGHLLNQN